MEYLVFGGLVVGAAVALFGLTRLVGRSGRNDGATHGGRLPVVG